VARNVGLTAASGEYVHFLDADDEVETDAYEKLYNYANTQKPDILIFDYYKYYVDSGKKVNKARSLKQNYNCATHKELVLKAGVVPWNKFFKRNFLLQNKLLFIENIAYEDVPFFWHTILVASKIYYMQGYFIKYNQYPNSRNTKTNLQGMIVANNLIFDFLSSNGEYKKYKNLFVIKMLKSYIFLLNTINSKEAFALVQDSIKFIHLKEYNISFVKYIKLYLLLKTNYTCYYLLKKIL
jgi:glycosyltransferase involved in cell wall biosynthesis